MEHIMQFSIPKQYEWDYLRDMWAELVGIFIKQSFSWKAHHRKKLPDQNYPSEAEIQTWKGPSSTLIIRIESSSGNPRDGYGYDVQIQIHATRNDQDLKISASGYFCWYPKLRDHILYIQGELSEEEEYQILEVVNRYTNRHQ